MDRETVLVVDDDELVLDSVRLSLKRGEFNVLAESDSRKGLERFFSEKPMCLVLDLRMPGIDGIEFLKKIYPTSDFEFGVVMLTGHGSPEDMKECFELGASAFIRKPFDIIELISIVGNVIKCKRAIVDLKAENESLRDELLLSDSLFEANSRPFIVFNKDGWVTKSNKTARSLLAKENGDKIPNVFDMLEKDVADHIRNRITDDIKNSTFPLALAGKSFQATLNILPFQEKNSLRLVLSLGTE